MAEVRLSDGTVLRFPDQMTPAQIEAATRRFVEQRGQQRRPAARPVPQALPRQQVPAAPAGPPTGLLSPPVANLPQLPAGAAPPPPVSAPPQVRLGDVAEQAQRTVERTVPQVGATRMQAFGRGLLNSFLSNALGIGNLPLPGPAGQVKRVAERGGLLAPPPGPEEARAGVRAAGRAVQGQSPDFLGALQQEQATTQQLREQQPGATMAGEVAGDVATLLTGRAPISRAVSLARQRLVQGGGRAFAQASPGIRRLVNQTLDSKTVRALADRAGRSLETGAEGAALAILDDGDPVETAAFAAGGQALGSVALGLTTTRKGLAGLAATAAGFGALIQLTKAAVPGGRDFILESLETGFEKVLWGLVAGAASATLGLGRRSSGRLAENLPALTDSLTAMRRGAALSFLNDLTKAEEQGDRTPELVVNKLSRDPEFFGRTAARRIERALNDPDVSLLDEIDRMSRLPSFREKLDELGGSSNGR